MKIKSNEHHFNTIAKTNVSNQNFDFALGYPYRSSAGVIPWAANSQPATNQQRIKLVDVTEGDQPCHTADCGLFCNKQPDAESLLPNPGKTTTTFTSDSHITFSGLTINPPGASMFKVCYNIGLTSDPLEWTTIQDSHGNALTVSVSG